jgi:heptosyltransferase-2
MQIKLDCRYFSGDRPCVFHKKTGIKCDTCKKYNPIRNKILIIKLDAPGDVLRTTCILQGLKEKYADSHITWITREDAIELLEGNEYIDRIWGLNSTEVIAGLKIENFDIVINPDASYKASSLASLAKANKRFGFGLDKRGFVEPFNEAAKKWLEMGAFDDVKKANKETYQKIILKIIGIHPKKYDIILNLSKEDLDFAKNFAKSNKINRKDLVIGLNTGAGSRWEVKKWTLNGYIRLIDKIKKKLNANPVRNTNLNRKNKISNGAKILLLGGPDEVERNKIIIKRSRHNLIDTGCHNSLRQFSALVNLCNLIVTSDTMALHIALALKKKVVVLFGPTSYNEVDLYGKGEKVFANMDCLCCYKLKCDKKPNCMDNISVSQIFNAIERLLKGK